MDRTLRFLDATIAAIQEEDVSQLEDPLVLVHVTDPCWFLGFRSILACTGIECTYITDVECYSGGIAWLCHIVFSGRGV